MVTDGLNKKFGDLELGGHRASLSLSRATKHQTLPFFLCQHASGIVLVLRLAFLATNGQPSGITSGLV